MRKNVAGQIVAGQVNSRTDGSPLTTGASVFVTIDGGTQNAGGGTATHEGNGCWSYAPTQAETNGNHVAFTFVHASGVNQTVNVYPVAYDPTNATTLGLTNLDATVSSRLATAGYTAPDNASVAAILVDTAAIDARLPSDPADQSVVIAATDAILTAVDTRLAASSYTAPDNTSVTAIKAKTDSLTFTKALELDVNLKSVNSVTVNGDGAGTPMGV